MLLQLVIKGQPVPKQSFRRTNAGFCYQTKEIVQAEKDIAMQIKSQLPKNFPITKKTVKVLRVWFIFEPIQSLKKHEKEFIEQGGYIPKSTKPDLDNLEKLLYDAMEGLIYYNDSQICEKNRILKMYGNNPRIEIEIEVKDE